MPDRDADVAEILVVELLGGLGDLIMVLPAVHALARRHPRARLRVVTHAPGADLLRTDPSIAEVIVSPPGGERATVVQAVAARRPDLAVTTTRHSGIPASLAPSRRRVDDLWRTPPADDPVTHRYLRILHAEGLVDEDDLTLAPAVALTPHEVADAESLLARLVPAGAPAPPVVLVPAAGMSVKQWPLRAWTRLASALTAWGHPVLSVTDLPVPASTLPALPLRGLAAVFTAAGTRGAVAVGGDTGPLRLAAACGTRTVGLFGPTASARYGIPGGMNLQGLPSCPHRRPTTITDQVCWWDAHCPLSPGEPACMADIPWQAVAQQAHRTADGLAPTDNGS